MGNTPSGGCHKIQFGKCASMTVSKSHGKAYTTGESYDHEKQSVVYSVDDRTCTASITTCKQPGSNRVKRFIISITDSDRVKSWRVWPYRFEMVVESSQGKEDSLKVSHAKTSVIQDDDILWYVPPIVRGEAGTNPLNVYEKDATDNPKKTIEPDGTITLTSLKPYKVQGSDKQKGLVVIELKKKSKDEIEDKIFEVIVWHYFASLRKTQAGFSVVAKMRGDENGLRLEGPELHPAAALFELFDKVSKRGYWTPYACPHCAEANYIHKHLPKGDNDGGASKGKATRLPINWPNGGIKSLFNGIRGIQTSKSESDQFESESESESDDNNGKGDGGSDTEKSLIQPTFGSKAVTIPRAPYDGKDPRRNTPLNHVPNGYVVKNYGTIVNY